MELDRAVGAQRGGRLEQKLRTASRAFEADRHDEAVRLLRQLAEESGDFITESKTYTAHSDITELFFTSDFSSISVFVSNPSLYSNFTFMLRTRPKGEQQHELKFIFKLDDGRVFEVSTNSILIH